MNPQNAPPHLPPPDEPYFRPQSRYFYTYCWTKKHDKAFIRALYYQARRGHRQLNRTPNMHSLMYARDVVNNGFGWPFKYHVIKRRLKLLRLRYTTFRRIINDPGFHWFPNHHYILAAEHHWEIDFANAYRFEDEPFWHEFQTIFSPADHGEQQVVPVVLSSNSEDSEESDREDWSGSDGEGSVGSDGEDSEGSNIKD